MLLMFRWEVHSHFMSSSVCLNVNGLIHRHSKLNILSENFSVILDLIYFDFVKLFKKKILID